MRNCLEKDYFACLSTTYVRSVDGLIILQTIFMGLFRLHDLAGSRVIGTQGEHRHTFVLAADYCYLPNWQRLSELSFRRGVRHRGQDGLVSTSWFSPLEPLSRR